MTFLTGTVCDLTLTKCILSKQNYRSVICLTAGSQKYIESKAGKRTQDLYPENLQLHFKKIHVRF